MRIIRAQLDGVDAQLGRVPAADVAHLILGLQRAIARAAYVVLGKSWRGTGRHTQAIEYASRLRLVDVERGSVVGLLALPEAVSQEPELPIAVPDLSALAVAQVLDAINAVGPDPDSGVAASVVDLATELGIGDRNRSLTLLAEDDAVPSGGARRATIDVGVRVRMQRLSAVASPRRDQALVGLLYEADFESSTARLRMPDGEVVTVSFPPEFADQIHQTLRARTWVEGLVRYHPRSSQAVSVELRALGRDTGLSLDPDAFWRSPSFAELQAGQGTTGMVDPNQLALEELSDDERVAFLADLAP
jgi:hypothetical protein